MNQDLLIIGMIVNLLLTTALFIFMLLTVKLVRMTNRTTRNKITDKVQRIDNLKSEIEEKIKELDSKKKEVRSNDLADKIKEGWQKARMEGRIGRHKKQEILTY